MQVVNSVRNTKTLRSLRGHLSPIYLARSSLRSLASFCRCSELMESEKTKQKQKHRDLSYEQKAVPAPDVFSKIRRASSAYTDNKSSAGLERPRVQGAKKSKTLLK